jgi:chaperone protein EcpD
MSPILRGLRAIVCALFLLSMAPAHAGVVLANTRVVFPGDAREVIVRMTNTRPTPVLVEAWIERDLAGDPVPFEIVPPLVRIEPGRGQALRVHRLPGGAPVDRESLFWLNVFESPPVADGATANAMHIAVRTRVKVFLRPPGLVGSAAKAPSKLTWRYTPGVLRIDNPTPFHVTIPRVMLGEDGLDLRGGMVPPFGHVALALDAPDLEGRAVAPERRAQVLRHAPTLAFLFINDSGGAERRKASLAQ